jgi:hypothetical protein
MSQKADYLKNVNFVSQKITIFGVLNVNFLQCMTFLFKVVLLFHISYLYIEDFFVLYSHG